jgi:hypothetical protein
MEMRYRSSLLLFVVLNNEVHEFKELVSPDSKADSLREPAVWRPHCWSNQKNVKLDVEVVQFV